MTKYIGYCRKSTDEPDRQILSIEAQVAELKEFASREGLEIVDFIIESKTAKTPGREKFSLMLKQVEKGNAAGIISWHPDRLARNSVDGGRIIYLLDTGDLKDLKFPTFWFENTPQGKFMLNIAFGQSKYYVDNLSENVRRGNRQKLRRGDWPNKAPFGYINNRENKSIQLDKKRYKYVQKAFKLFATGGYSQVDVRNFFTRNGVFNTTGTELHMDKIKRILTNPFYYGVMRFAGEFYEGNHTPLISKKLFDQVQEVLRGKGRKVQARKDDFYFLGLIKCGECGASVTAEKQTKHYLRTKRVVDYVYYRCTKKVKKCSQKYVRREVVEDWLRDTIYKVSISPFAAEKFFEFADRDVEAEKSRVESVLTDLTQQLSEIDLKLDRLLEAYLDKVIGASEYKQKKEALVKKKAFLKGRKKEVKTKGNEWLEPFSEFINCAQDAQKIARKKNNCHDLAVMAKTVGSNYFLKDQRLKIVFRNPQWHELFHNGCAREATQENVKVLDLLATIDAIRTYFLGIKQPVFIPVFTK